MHLEVGERVSGKRKDQNVFSELHLCDGLFGWGGVIFSSLQPLSVVFWKITKEMTPLGGVVGFWQPPMEGGWGLSIGTVVSSGLLQLRERGLSYQGVRIPHWRP